MKLKAILLTISILIFILALTGGILYYQNAKFAAIQKNHDTAATIVNNAAEDINAHLLKNRAAISRLAASAPLQEVLLKPTPATLAEANAALDSFNSAFHDSTVYLLDVQGNTIASSNRHLPGSFVGHNYGFRPYFQEAIQGQAAIFLGLGVPSRQPGIYQSHPVYDLNSEHVIGVAVGKFPSDDLLDEINQEYYRGIVTITGPDDIIFWSSSPDLTGKFLWESSPPEPEKLAATRQFGPGPWPWSGFRKIAASQAVDPAGRNFVIHQHNIESLRGWHLTFLHDPTISNADATATLAREIGTFLAFALTIISLLVISLYSLANQEIKRRKQAEGELLANQQHLEMLLEKRTAALRHTNEELQSEVEAHKKDTQKLELGHERHRAITDAAKDSIIMINHLAEISFWNPAAERLFGFTREEALGQKLHDLITPEIYRAKAHARFANFLKTGQDPIIGKSVELPGLNKKGAQFPLELSISSLRQGQNWAAVAIIRDISERKHLEDEKMKMEKLLQQAQKMEAIGTLAAGIAHDFNNILSSILGYAELVREDMSPTCTESLADLAQVIKAGNRAKELVKLILAFSQQHDEEKYPIQISLVVKEALKLLRATLPGNIEIKQMISAASTTVLSDPIQIHQIIMNLCTNSYRAMRQNGGILEVRLETFVPDAVFTEIHPDLPANQFLCLTVSDTGHGIAPAVLPRIFDPYFSTNKKEDGTGLGLAVVHGIVTHLGGAIEVTSKLDLGTTFKIFLPVVKSSAERAKLPIYPEKHGSETILLVDDELPILQLEERMLVSLGYKTVCRTSSIEALALFRNQPARFDLVVTDHSMPNMTGVKLAEEMVEIRPEIPIILCTGYFELDIPEQIRENVIRKIVMKPVNKNELAHAIRQVLDHEKNQ